MSLNETNTFQEVLTDLISSKLANVDVTNTNDFHETYLRMIEPPLLVAVMRKTRYNQVRAAKLLGVSRSTLRKKLIAYFDDRYCGPRGEFED